MDNMKTDTICPLCKNKKHQQWGDYLLCDKCKLIFLSEKKEEKSLIKSYTGGFLKSLRRKIFSRFRHFESYGQYFSFMSKADKVTALIKKNIKDKKEVSLLDIGCNKGFLLHSAIQKGWNVYGIELVPELLIPFKNKYKGLSDSLYIGSFDDNYNKLKKNSFDVISMIDVIEHFNNPAKTLKKVHSLLKKDGILIVQTPDSMSSMSKNLKSSWPALKKEEHLCVFNKKNYKQMMTELEFVKTSFYKPFDEADGNFVAISQK
jgi:2-polyprenyl-3-methyl-5-hydroxy-6-metoxy-1,4-benzoquinol methylase